MLYDQNHPNLCFKICPELSTQPMDHKYAYTLSVIIRNLFHHHRLGPAFRIHA